MWDQKRGVQEDSKALPTRRMELLFPKMGKGMGRVCLGKHLQLHFGTIRFAMAVRLLWAVVWSVGYTSLDFRGEARYRDL